MTGQEENSVNTIKNIIRRCVRFLGYDIHTIDSGMNGIIKDDEEFNKTLKEVKNHTLLDLIPCYMLYQFAKATAHVKGNIAEVGCYRGGSGKLLSRAVAGSGKKVHLFDTFGGMPPANPEIDSHKEGDFPIDYEEIIKFFSDCDNVILHRGFFPDTAAGMGDARFCFVHADADLYQSTADCCRFFYPKLERGGVIIFHDFDAPKCPGVRKAIGEFFADKPERPIALPMYQCFVVKQ